MADRTPELAPRCLACGYNLFRNAARLCPECGARIESAEDLEAARWLADANLPDRHAVQRLRVVRWLGWGAISTGVALCASDLLIEPGW